MADETGHRGYCCLISSRTLVDLVEDGSGQMKQIAGLQDPAMHRQPKWLYLTRLGVVYGRRGAHGAHGARGVLCVHDADLALGALGAHEALMTAWVVLMWGRRRDVQEALRRQGRESTSSQVQHFYALLEWLRGDITAYPGAGRAGEGAATTVAGAACAAASSEGQLGSGAGVGETCCAMMQIMREDAANDDGIPGLLPQGFDLVDVAGLASSADIVSQRTENDMR